MSQPSVIRILLAAAPVSREPILRALGPGYEVTSAHTLWQARSLLLQPIDLVVCGLCFDESRMFDLLRHAQAKETSRAIPFLVVNATDAELGPAILQGIEIACEALGAQRFIELAGWERRHGVEQAHERFRATVKLLLAAAA